MTPNSDDRMEDQGYVILRPDGNRSTRSGSVARDGAEGLTSPAEDALFENLILRGFIDE